MQKYLPLFILPILFIGLTVYAQVESPIETAPEIIELFKKDEMTDFDKKVEMKMATSSIDISTASLLINDNQNNKAIIERLDRIIRLLQKWNI